MRLPQTFNIQCRKQLSGKSKEDILEEVLIVFPHYHIKCVQVAHEVIRVTLASADEYKVAKQQPGIRLFGMWCPILGGGPPVTIIHVFDYPYEEDDVYVKNVLGDFGTVKRVKKQTYLSKPDVFTGTRLVSVTLEATPPRFITINGYLCRIWYKGQPLICNLCGVQGYKSAGCPNKDKCRRCGEVGHFARSCPPPPPRNAATPLPSVLSTMQNILHCQANNKTQTLRMP